MGFAFTAPVALDRLVTLLRARGLDGVATSLAVGAALAGAASPFAFVATHRPWIGLDGLASIPGQLDRRILPEGTPIFVYDLPGTMGFLAGLDALPADGLMSDPGYDAAVAEEGIETYLARRGIHYLLGPGPIVERGTPKEPCSRPSLYLGSTRFRCEPLDERRFRVVGVEIHTPFSGRAVGTLPLPEDAVVDTFDFDGRSYAV